MAIAPLLSSNLLAVLPQQWQMLSFLAFLPILLLSFLVLTRSRHGSSKGVRLPPGPARLPILGNLHQLGTLPHRSLRDLARKHGPVMLLRLGTVPAVVVSSAEAAREVMKVHDTDCCSRPASPGPRLLSYLKDVAFAPYDEYWREMRKLFIVELLSMRRVKAAWYAREQQVDKLLEDLQRMGPKPVALNDHIFGLADGIVGTVAFGNIYGTEQFAQKKHFQHVLDEAMDMLVSFSAEDFFPNVTGRFVDRVTGLVNRRERIFKELDAFYEMVIDQHMDPERPKAENGGDLVDVLINLWKEHQGTLQFTRDHVKAMIMNTFIGGIDTSSVTMLWAMSELIRKPQVLKKAQEEAAPATLLLPRETLRDVKIGGYDVPAKTRLFVNAWAVGRDPASWTDAEEFNPDRFEALRDVDVNGAHYELIPFGAGRRICPGLAMGMANVEFTLANLLCCFDWSLPEGMKPEDVSMDEAGGLTFHRKTPLVLVPTRYTRSESSNNGAC
ncbi:hypothetical protein PR202_ga20656 [Eleusine coracana subsp. coracana]|uniref:4-hydroxyphenylacetaldehyde oxime monooxygenase n=1 Tax=Eleusine coracana subsp. coracana TaxID=191504 RepID=A0AAV5CXZ5_ELECO|nr:hypothetical protein PR202_ga20656 [Eleusine coracana subsp. coracana]